MTLPNKPNNAFDLTAHLTTLSQIHAPSGHEAPARDAIRAAWSPYVDEFQTDGLGSLIAIKRGTADVPRRVMLSAHMDEVGLLVAEIRDGFIRASSLPDTFDNRVLLMQPVLVHGRRTLSGVFGAAPPHMALNRKQYPTLDELWVDVGLPADDVAELVRIGDLITYDSPVVALKGERLAGKSFDDRSSVAAVTVCLEELTRRSHAWDVVAVASVQEEINAYGAMAAAYQIQPDIAIAIDVTFGTQPGTNEDETFKVGGGPTISRGPNFHPKLVRALRDAADDLEMKVQIEGVPGDSGTDAWVIQVSREGVPSVLIGIPLRNMHSPVEVLDLRDVRRAGRLMAHFIAGCAPDFLDTIAYESGDA